MMTKLLQLGLQQVLDTKFKTLDQLLTHILLTQMVKDAQLPIHLLTKMVEFWENKHCLPSKEQFLSLIKINTKLIKHINTTSRLSLCLKDVLAIQLFTNPLQFHKKLQKTLVQDLNKL